MQQQGLQDLIMFRDELQQPEPTGMERLSLLQDMVGQDRIDRNMQYEMQPMMMNTGLMSLPVVQARLGSIARIGKRLTSIPRKIVKGVGRVAKGVTKGVRNVAKSPIGRIALPLALAYFGPTFLPALGGLPAPALYGGTTGLSSLLAGDDPEEAFRKGATAAALTYVGGKVAGSGSAQGAAGKTLPTDSSSYANFAKANPVRPEFAVGAEGTGAISGVSSAPSVGSVGAPPTNYQDFAMQTNVQPEFPVGDVAADQAALDASMSPLTKIQDALASGVQKVRDLPKLQQAALGVGGLSLLGGSQDIPQSQLDVAGLRKKVITDFDQQRVVYEDAEGNPIDYQTALRMIQQASQSFGPGGQRKPSGVRLAYERVNPNSNFQGASPEQLANVVKNVKLFNEGGMVDPVLSASGGLIGMSYGGSMPMNNMDVKYKEFSGMVGGRGSGMEDNVYMPIVEGEQGQQVATLAVSPKEYVIDANTMSLLGNGNPDEGAEIMDETVKDIRMAATGQKKQQKEIDGLAALDRMRRSV